MNSYLLHFEIDTRNKLALGLGRFFILCLISYLVTGCNLNAPKPGNQVLITKGLSGNLIDGYWLYLPKNFEDSKRYPVILFLSGGAGVSSHKRDAKNEGPAKFAIQDNIDSELVPMVQDSFIIINPHMDIGPSETRGWQHHSETLFKIVEEVANDYSGDLSRLILTGLSHGGSGTWNIAKEHSEKISALVSVSGITTCKNDCESFGDTPFWIIHNTGDNVVSIRYPDTVTDFLIENYQIEIARMDTINDTPQSEFLYSRISEEGHDAWNSAYSNPDVYKWLLEKTRN